MDNYQAVIDRTRCVRRFLIPVMSDDYIPGRRRRHGLTEQDLDLVAHGFACPECLACWEGDTQRLVCPVGGHERDASDFLDGVKEWEEYRAYVQHELDNPTSTKVPSMRELINSTMPEALEGHIPGVRRNL